MKRIFVVLFVLSLCSTAYAQECSKPEVSEFDPGKYYLSAEGKKGKELKKALNGIIKGHVRHNYKCVWEILREADEDKENENNMIGFYSRRSIPKIDQDRGGDTPDYWNREYVWSKSHGFPNRSQHGFTDAHHLRAADKSCNSKRGSRDFANGGERDEECKFHLGSGTVESPDLVKGDTARMMFYMAVRYEGDDGNTPNLELVDRRTETGEPLFGKLCTLLEWHKKDPVADEERKRNDVIYNWQGNRNPFIDRPEWVESIWGGECVGD